MRKRIYLNYIKSKIVDREEFLKRYDVPGNKQQLRGAPILVNVEGSYVKLNDLQSLTNYDLTNYIASVNVAAPDPFTGEEEILYIFRWRRNHNGVPTR